MAAGVLVLSGPSLEEEIATSDVPVLLEVGASWCPPCRAMGPVLTTIAHEYTERLRVLAVDADADRATVTRFKVSSMPTFLVFQDGRLVKRLVGARSKHRLLDDLAEFLT